MRRALIVYASTEGQTASVVERVAARLRSAGLAAEALSVVDAPDVLPEADLAVVAGSVHYGKHQAPLVAWAGDHREALAARPSAFLSVSLAAAGDTPAGREEAEGYASAFVEQTGWRPDVVACIGGALRYSRYGFLKRQLMRVLARRQRMPTDTSRDHELTDWDEVDRIADDCAALVRAS